MSKGPFKNSRWMGIDIIWMQTVQFLCKKCKGSASYLFLIKKIFASNFCQHCRACMKLETGFCRQVP